MLVFASQFFNQYCRSKNYQNWLISSITLIIYVELTKSHPDNFRKSRAWLGGIYEETEFLASACKSYAAKS
jgi:hypothetical protein